MNAIVVGCISYHGNQTVIRFVLVRALLLTIYTVLINAVLSIPTHTERRIALSILIDGYGRVVLASGEYKNLIAYHRGLVRYCEVE